MEHYDEKIVQELSKEFGRVSKVDEFVHVANNLSILPKN